MVGNGSVNMHQVPAVLPRVFTINLPRGVKFDDLAEALVAKRPLQTLKGLHISASAAVKSRPPQKM